MNRVWVRRFIVFRGNSLLRNLNACFSDGDLIRFFDRFSEKMRSCTNDEFAIDRLTPSRISDEAFCVFAFP